MARKGSLIGTMKAAADQAEADVAVPGAVHRASAEMTTTAVHIPKETLALLRRVAVERANLHGGRPSVSAVITELAEARRPDLEREAAVRS